MGKIRPFIFRVGCDSIVLIIIDIFSMICACRCSGIFADLCISFVSGTIIYVITTIVPRCKQRKDKFLFIKSRVERIIGSGKSLFHNMYSKDELCSDSNIINQIPSDKEIEDICLKRDLRIAPTAYFYTSNEQPSWDLLFCKCLNNLNHTITEMVAISGPEKIGLVNLCEDIRKKIEYINISISVHLSANPEIAEVRGDFICTDMQDLAKMLRELQEHNK